MVMGKISVLAFKNITAVVYLSFVFSVEHIHRRFLHVGI